MSPTSNAFVTRSRVTNTPALDSRSNFIDGPDLLIESQAEGHILGSEEFVDSTIHRIGDTPRRRSEHRQGQDPSFVASALIAAVASVFGLSADQFCGPEKSAKAVLAKEVLILIGREHGAAVTELSLI